MTTVGLTIDYFLYALVAVTLGLSLYKAVELWAPTLMGRQAHAEALGRTERSIDEGLERLEAGLTFLAVIAAMAPFVGLAGTVVHVMDALRALGSAGADVAVISGPVVTALKATLVGLASAIPAAVAHSLMVRRVQVLENRQRRALAPV
jgi:biopolymer transport protein ExbB/TolQ